MSVDEPKLGEFWKKMTLSILFRHLPEALREIGGPKVADIVTRRAAREIAAEFKELLVERDVEDALSLIYRLYGLKSEEYSVEKSDDYVKVKIFKCPFRELVEKNGSGCEISRGLKRGLLEEVLGKEVYLSEAQGRYPLFLRTAHMLSGDPYCEFTLFF